MYSIEASGTQFTQQVIVQESKVISTSILCVTQFYPTTQVLTNDVSILGTNPLFILDSNVR